MANDYFRQVFKQVSGRTKDVKVGIQANGCGYSSCCQRHKSDGNKYQKRKCDIIFRRFQPIRTPIIRSNRGIYYEKGRYWCNSHKNWVDILHDGFKLGESDQYFEETQREIFNDNRGIYKYNDFIYDQATFTDLWSIFSETGRVSEALNLLKRQWETYYEYELSKTPGKLEELENDIRGKGVEGCIGTKKVIWLNKGIYGDDTHGHIDDIARFVSKNKIFIAQTLITFTLQTFEH